MIEEKYLAWLREQKSGAGEVGTTELTDTYKKETPGEGKSSCPCGKKGCTCGPDCKGDCKK